MKNLSKCFLIVLICVFSLQSFAQKYGIVGGLNLADMLIKDDDGTYSDDFKMQPGFHVGVLVDMPLTDMLSVEPGLLLETKGLNGKLMDEFGSYESKITNYYLDVPVTLKATHALNDGMKLYGKIGLYLGIGLSGKEKWEGTYEGITESGTDDISWGSGDDDHFKRLDYGATAGVGVQISKITVGASYDLGLANISSDTSYGAKINNKLLKFSIGYWFGE